MPWVRLTFPQSRFTFPMWTHASRSVVAPACVAQVKGFGAKGYEMALDLLLDGEYARLGEGFEEKVRGKVIVGTPDGPKALELA